MAAARKARKANCTIDPRCWDMLESLQSHKYAGPFLAPVDPEALGIPDYFKIIKEPMDFGTIEKKLAANKYATEDQFAADMRQVFHNCKTYNLPGSEIFHQAEALSDVFNKQWSRMKTRKRKGGNDEGEKPMSRAEKKQLCEAITALDATQLAGMLEIIQKRNHVPKETMEVEISIDELDAITLRELERFVGIAA